MRQSSSPSIHHPSSVSRSPYVSCNPATTRFGEIEKIFNCGGCMIAEDEVALSPVVTVLYHQASYGDEDKFDIDESTSKQSTQKGNSISSAPNSTKHTNSDSSQGTQSMSQSDDDDISVDSHCDSEREQEEDTPTSILRRKGKLGTNVVTNTTHDRVRVRFAKETKFSDPNEIPSPIRQKDPRFTQKQREEYTTMNNYYQSTVPQQLNLSSLLIYEYN
mmetsp:Transcript_31295/g.31782  ORF Transcript_31295/g.31782 Transcript_31295/m.31782 type:complete len:218 (+) Transcript_31295:230-883(+)